MTVRFNGDQLRVLRRFHNLTQRELAELVGASPSTINGYELGRSAPKDIALGALCAALQVEPSYFEAPGTPDEFLLEETNFRSLVSTSDRTRKQVLAHGTLVGELIAYVSREVMLPALNLPSLSAETDDDLEGAAEACRTSWGVGLDAPIENVTHTLEHAGIVITSLRKDVGRKVDAFSRYGLTNLIVLNPAKGSATRMRTDLAHEAGHGALHRKGVHYDLATRERQANYFAGALLMPRRAFAREFWAAKSSRSWLTLFSLKSRWGASVPAVVTRAYQLGLLDAAEYQRRFKYMAKAGWLRGGEPEEPDAEQPQLFMMALNHFRSATGKDVAAMSSDLGWTSELFVRVAGIPAEPATPADVSSLEAYRKRRMASN